MSQLSGKCRIRLNVSTMWQMQDSSECLNYVANVGFV